MTLTTVSTTVLYCDVVRDTAELTPRALLQRVDSNATIHRLLKFNDDRCCNHFLVMLQM